MVSALSVKYHLIMYGYVLPTAILISFPSCLLDWRISWISPKECQRNIAIGRLVASPILDGCHLPISATMKRRLEFGRWFV